MYMKKFLYLAAVAAATMSLAGCNKDMTPTVKGLNGPEISIRTVGANSITKSAMNGTAFPQGYDMLVSAYRNLGPNAGEDVAADYFEGIRFGYDDTSGSWKSEMGVKYYPLDGTLDFLAVASAGINASGTGSVPTAVWGESSNVAKKVVLTVPDNSAKFDDLMYGASNAEGLSASGTGITFKHAMTSVVFLAKCNVAYNAGTNAGITVDGITIDGAKHSGTLTVSNPSAGGGSGDLSAAWSSLGDAQTHVAARVWNASNTGILTNESALANLNLGTASKALASYPFGEAYVILPPQAAVPFTVTYTIHNGFASDGSTPLNKQVQYQYIPSGTWDMGKKNVYEVEFDLTEILVNPDIVDWDEVENDLIQVPEPEPEPEIDPANGHAYVDLGLRSGGNKILFATMNIGASSPEEYGDYFAWGDVVKRYSAIAGSTVTGHSFNMSNYLYANNCNLTKYCSDSYYSDGGFTDALTILEAADDVASVTWEGDWRMPDSSELWMLLSSAVNHEWTSDYNSTGVAGLLVTGKGEFSSASLFLPAAGDCVSTSRHDAGDFGHYWSRSLYVDEPVTALRLYFGEGEDVLEGNRYSGYSVRPVRVVAE